MDDWTALIRVSKSGAFWHVTIQTNGSSESAALSGSEVLTWLLGKAGKVLFRSIPSAMSETSFDPPGVFHRGRARFSIVPAADVSESVASEKQGWKNPDPDIGEIVGFK